MDEHCKNFISQTVLDSNSKNPISQNSIVAASNEDTRIRRKIIVLPVPVSSEMGLANAYVALIRKNEGARIATFEPAKWTRPSAGGDLWECLNEL